jgi:glycosyltransferase involved in cell wall biosynthesis
MPVNSLDAGPRVSILINNYNYGCFLAAAIDSALNQTYANKEVIVVDDGSTDNSREVIASYGDEIVPVLKPNGGQASAFNAGFAASQGDIICFLDADDAFLPGKVAAIVKVLHNYQESAWCFHPLQISESPDQPLVLEECDLSSVTVQACDLRLVMRQGGKGLRQTLPFSLPATTGLCFTRSLLQQILPMPEADGIAIGDSYVQFISLTLAKGFAISNKLALQRVHSSNLYTRNVNRKAATARIFCLTAFWMRTKFSFLNQFANNFFAAGLSDYWQVRQKDDKTQEVIEKYLTPLQLWQRFKIRAKALYYYFTSNHVE